jgi:short-subunit dehydrogenase
MLVNNAGVGFTSRFGDSTFRQNETTIQLNIGALVRLTHLLLPGLRLHRKAWILNVASLGAYFPMPSMPVYSSTKSFVLSFSLVLRDELRASGVSVSVVCPNGIRTNRRCRELIERQGWAGRVTCQYPDEVARAAINGLFRGKPVIVPGAANKVLLHAGSLVPRTLYMRVISQRWKVDAAPRAKRCSPAAGLSAAAAEA